MSSRRALVPCYSRIAASVSPSMRRRVRCSLKRAASLHAQSLRIVINGGCRMAAVGLAEASRLTGKNVSTIHRAMKVGRLSYTMSAAGERQIEVAELERVFGLKFQSSGNLDGGNGAMPGIDAGSMRRNSAHRGEIAALHRLIDAQAATITDLRATIRTHEAGLDDLRHRLDASEAERRQLSERLTGLLPHRQAGSVPSVALRLPWWRRWLP